MASETRPVETKVLYIGESVKTFCADFQDYPEVTSNESLSNPSVSVTNNPSNVTLTPSSPTVLTTDFIEYDRNGKVNELVPSGKGVTFLVSIGSTRGQCTVTVLVTADGGATIGKQVDFVIK